VVVCILYLAIEDNCNGWSKGGFISDTGGREMLMLLINSMGKKRMVRHDQFFAQTS
jgi:hypothetical protein